MKPNTKMASVEEFNSLYYSIKPAFYDFGCSKGDSLIWAERVFAEKNEIGLGIDISETKLKATAEKRLHAIGFNILEIPQENKVRFTILSHFLEHVDDYLSAKEFIRKACEVSTSFVLIKQPYFDADGFLFQIGFKCYWSHWTGHPNTMSTLNMYRILKELKDEGCLSKFSIHLKHKIDDSNNPVIIPAETGIDQFDYNPELHPKKGRKVKFHFPVYKETIAIITKSDDLTHKSIQKKVKIDKTIIDENEKIIEKAVAEASFESMQAKEIEIDRGSKGQGKMGRLGILGSNFLPNALKVRKGRVGGYNDEIYIFLKWRIALISEVRKLISRLIKIRKSTR